MNGIERISQRLISDAEAEIAALNAETEAQCQAIQAEYQEKAKQAYEQRMQDGKRACQQRTERYASAAELEARKSILAFKQELVSKTFDAAAAQLTKLPREDYVAFLAKQAAAAASYGEEELIFNAEDAANVGKAVAKAANELLQARGVAGNLTVSEETRPIPGGVIVRMGDIEVNCAVNMLVEMRRGELAAQVAELLFT